MAQMSDHMKPMQIYRKLATEAEHPGELPSGRKAAANASASHKQKADSVMAVIRRMCEDRLEKGKSIIRSQWFDGEDYTLLLATDESLETGSLFVSNNGPYRLSYSPLYLDPKYENGDTLLMEVLCRNVVVEEECGFLVAMFLFRTETKKTFGTCAYALKRASPQIFWCRHWFTDGDKNLSGEIEELIEEKEGAFMGVDDMHVYRNIERKIIYDLGEGKDVKDKVLADIRGQTSRGIKGVVECESRAEAADLLDQRSGESMR